MITHSIQHGNSRSKVLCDLQTKIYKIHVIISWIRRFEFLPLWSNRSEIEWIKAKKLKTDVQWRWGRWMEAMLWLKTARFSLRLQLPCEGSRFNSGDSSRFSTILLQQIFNNACRRWIYQEQCKSNAAIDQKKLKNFEKILRELRWFLILDLRLWLWIWIFCYD